MRTLRLTLAGAIVCVAAVVFASPSPAYVQPAGPTLSIALQIAPTTVIAGQPVTVTVSVTNLTLLKQTTTAVVTLTPPKSTTRSGPIAIRVPVTVDPSSTFVKEFTHKIPLSVMKGSWTAMLTVPGAAAPVMMPFTVT